MMGSYNRDVSRRKALRKQHISKCSSYWSPESRGEHFDNLHWYSKNKVHCSCPLCNSKTRNKGRRNRANYQRSINYKKSDLVKQMSMDAQMEEYDGRKIHRRTKNW